MEEVPVIIICAFFSFYYRNEVVYLFVTKQQTHDSVKAIPNCTVLFLFSLFFFTTIKQTIKLISEVIPIY